MTVYDETPDTDPIEDPWQFEDAAPTTTTDGGGGLLRQILDQVTSLRDGAQADRTALADALSASFAKLEVELEVMREQVAALRADLDASGTAMTNAFTEVLKVVGAEDDVDIPAVVDRVVAAHSQANVEAVVAALSPEFEAVRKSVPTSDTARIALEITRLRQSLIGGPAPTKRAKKA